MIEKRNHINVAAELLRKRPYDDDATFDALIVEAAVMLRERGDEAGKLRAEIERLRALLRDIEWNSFGPPDGHAAACPCCGAGRDRGHRADCRLAAALASTPATTVGE